MAKIFYIADLHIGHKDILAFDNRPFFDLRNMRETIIKNWNTIVEENDDVYVLGDVFWDIRDTGSVLGKLEGNIHLIRGNHDEESLLWDSVSDYREIEDNGRHVILSHYPIPFYKGLHRADFYHLYGHLHASFAHNMMESWRKQIEALYLTEWKGFNVGCMLPYMNYTPRTLDEIIEGARRYRE